MNSPKKNLSRNFGGSEILIRIQKRTSIRSHLTSVLNMPLNGLGTRIHSKEGRNTMVMKDTEAGIPIEEGYISYWAPLMNYTLMD